MLLGRGLCVYGLGVPGWKGLRVYSLGSYSMLARFLLEVPEASTKPTRAHLGLLRTETGRAT